MHSRYKNYTYTRFFFVVSYRNRKREARPLVARRLTFFGESQISRFFWRSSCNISTKEHLRHHFSFVIPNSSVHTLECERDKGRMIRGRTRRDDVRESKSAVLTRFVQKCWQHCDVTFLNCVTCFDRKPCAFFTFVTNR